MNKISGERAPTLAIEDHQPDPGPPTYKQYYLRVINQQQQTEDFAGLKPVIGPTGIGKTMPIPNVIAQLLTQVTRL